MKKLWEKIKKWSVGQMDLPRWYIILLAIVLTLVSVEVLGYWSNGVLLLIGVFLVALNNVIKR